MRIVFAIAVIGLVGDSPVAGTRVDSLSGLGKAGKLKPLKRSKEFWHSWRTLQPATERY